MNGDSIWLLRRSVCQPRFATEDAVGFIHPSKTVPVHAGSLEYRHKRRGDGATISQWRTRAIRCSLFSPKQAALTNSCSALASRRLRAMA